MVKQANTLIFGAISLMICATSTFALPARSFERAELFAICSGRLSALATRQRALNADTASDMQAMAEEFEMLLEATTPFAVEDGMPWGQPKLWHARGWREVAGLLSDADYSFDASLSERAMQAVDHRINACRAVLLPGSDG